MVKVCGRKGGGAAAVGIPLFSVGHGIVLRTAAEHLRRPVGPLRCESMAPIPSTEVDQIESEEQSRHA